MLCLQTFNDALLAKWYWYWIRPEDRLWKSIFRIAYDFTDMSDIPDCKFFKENIHRLLPFCENFMKREVGTGQTIKFWAHNWGHGHLKFELHHLYKEVKDKGITVNQIFQLQDRENEDLFHDLGTIASNPQAIQQLNKFNQILTNLTIHLNARDNAIWLLESTQMFTVKSTYQGLMNMPTIQTNIQRIWKYKVAPRIRIFAWLTYYNRILTNDNLAKRGWHLPSMCFMCRNAIETVKNLFSECPFMLQLYGTVERRVFANSTDWRALLQKKEAQKWIVAKGGDRKTKEMLLLGMFVGWRERCSRIFKDQMKTQLELVQEVDDMWRTNH